MTSSSNYPEPALSGGDGGRPTNANVTSDPVRLGGRENAHSEAGKSLDPADLFSSTSTD